MKTRTKGDERNGAKVGKDSIEARAYEIYQARGKVAGRDQEDWFQAERELLGTTAAWPSAELPTMEPPPEERSSVARRSITRTRPGIADPDETEAGSNGAPAPSRIGRVANATD